MDEVQVEEEEAQRLEEEHTPGGLDALRIPGTQLTGRDVVAFDRQLACVAREGQWVYNATPRWIPWDLNPLTIARQPN